VISCVGTFNFLGVAQKRYVKAPPVSDCWEEVGGTEHALGGGLVDPPSLPGRDADRRHRWTRPVAAHALTTATSTRCRSRRHGTRETTNRSQPSSPGAPAVPTRSQPCLQSSGLMPLHHWSRRGSTASSLPTCRPRWRSIRATIWPGGRTCAGSMVMDAVSASAPVTSRAPPFPWPASPMWRSTGACRCHHASPV
jgi:hypothetical protein